VFGVGFAPDLPNRPRIVHHQVDILISATDVLASIRDLRRASSCGVHLLLAFSGTEFALRFQPGLSRAQFFIESFCVRS
jgi:hypothetical protein